MVVTLRERAVISLREAPGVSTLELDAGKLALTVSRERVKPGEVVEIKTPDAIARMRGTIVVAEILTDPSGNASRFTVMTGIVEVIPLDSGTAQPAPIGLDPMQTVIIRKGTPPGAVKPVTRANAHSVMSLFSMVLWGTSSAPASPPPPPPPSPADWTLVIDRGSGFDLWFGVTPDNEGSADKPLDHTSLAKCDAVARTLAQSGARVACARLGYLESRRPNPHRDSDGELMARGPMAGQFAVYESGAASAWKLVPVLGYSLAAIWRLDQQVDPNVTSLELAACYEMVWQQFVRGWLAACVRLPHSAVSDYHDVRGRLMVEGPFAGDLIVHDPAPPPTSP
jgi:hypothetical protein